MPSEMEQAAASVVAETNVARSPTANEAASMRTTSVHLSCPVGASSTR